MKHKPVLMKAIKLEELENNRKLKNDTIAKKKVKKTSTVEIDKKSKDVKNLKRSRSPTENKSTKNTNLFKLFFSSIYKIIALLINLLISFLESFQWIVISIIITIAVIIILNYSGISVSELIDKMLELIKNKPN